MFRLVTRIREYYNLLGVCGLLKLIKVTLTGQSTEFSITLPGIKHHFVIRLGTTDVKTLRHIFSELEYEARFEGSPKVIIDAGANIGLASIYFAKIFPEARIISIEPELSNFHLLKRNTSQYENITPIRAALWKEKTTIDLINRESGHWGFQTVKNSQENSNGKVDEVNAITIDNVMKENSIDYIDILKLDIEGAEKEVFEGMPKWVGKVGVLVIELHERYKVGCNRSFYNASNGFDFEWHNGENIFLAREGSALLPMINDLPTN